MASAGGFEDERFAAPVSQNLHCGICSNVSKNPMQCLSNEHSFCQPCITRHLQQTQTCPTCLEPLTLETLRPSRKVQRQAEVHSVVTTVRPLETNSTFSGSVVIAGGARESAQDIVEVLNWSTKQWTPLRQRTRGRCRTSSFVYQQKMFVCGGGYNGNSIEVLKLTEENGEWKEFREVKLPQKTLGHSCVVCEDNLFIFGGHIVSHSDVNEVLNDIYKVYLRSLHRGKLVKHMPEPRSLHGAQCFGSEVFIVGGTTTGDYHGCLNSVLVFDIRTNSCQTISTLPYHVCDMATVAWKDNIVIIGGLDRNSNALNTVVVYNIKNKQSRMLPSMKHKRAGCCAVMIGNNIVVMGGQNEQGYLNSVECFNVDHNSWEELPSMNVERYGATAVVKV